jgi:NADH dehydrogenase
MEEMMILVVGGTGDLGSEVARRLLADGQRVRALVRSEDRGAALRAAGAELVTGDLKDPDSLRAACAGIETVISTANSAKRGGDDNPQTVDLEGNRHLVDAAKAAGVGQFIFVSALGARSDSPVPFLAAKGKTEEYLRASGMPFTIISPTAFMEVWAARLVGAPAQAGQPVTLVGEGRRKHSFISAGDVASFVIAAIGHPAARNAQLVIGGPEALSFRDVVAVYERALGREIPVRTVKPGEPIPGVPPAVAGIAASFDTYDSAIDMTETAQTFGVKLTTLEDAVRRQAGAV